MMVSRAVCMAVCAVALVWLLTLLLTGRPLELHWALQTCFAAAAFLSSSYVAVTQYQFWRSPLQRAQQLVSLIRDGDAAIEELSAVRGGITPLMPQVQQLLRDLRQARQDLAKLQAEMQQRVAQRTSALERTIGSLRQQATKDSLTGLHNRRMLDQHLPQLLASCRDANTDLALIMMDVDNFKLVNDTLGHEAGDQLLMDVAQIIKSSIRGDDLAFRCGGDEFLVLLPNCQAPAAEAMAQRLVALVDQLARTIHLPVRPRLSVGISMLADGIGSATDELLRRADQMLYQMKSDRKQARGIASPRLAAAGCES